MRIYHSGGFKELTIDSFMDYSAREGLKLGFGKLKSLKILERKTASNEGNALEGGVIAEDGSGFVMCIGGNPIGTGHKYYIPFLEESDCKKVGHLYVLKSLLGRIITYTFKGDNIRGYLSKKGLSEINELSRK